jgi:hypothetical protein
LVCKSDFPSRNKLFLHLEAKGCNLEQHKKDTAPKQHDSDRTLEQDASEPQPGAAAPTATATGGANTKRKRTDLEY